MSISTILDSFHAYAAHPGAKDYKLTSWCDAFMKQNALRAARPQLRASSLFYTCPRAAVFDSYVSKPGDPYSFTSYLAMELGTSAHKLVQNDVLGPLGVLWGTWRNTNNDRRTTGFHPEPRRAMSDLGQGNPRRWEFVESILFDEELCLTGHADGYVSFVRLDAIAKMPRKDLVLPISFPPSKNFGEDESDFALLEIKTAGSYSYKTMTSGARTIPDGYKMQAAIYQGISGTRQTLFWIINRDTFESACVSWSDTDGAWWRLVRQKARMILSAVQDVVLPEELRACVVPTCARAKKCPYSKKCFDRSYSLRDDPGFEGLDEEF